MWFAGSSKTLNSLSELETGSDRTVGIVVGAIVESHLTDILRDELLPNKSELTKRVQGHMFPVRWTSRSIRSEDQPSLPPRVLSPDGYEDIQTLKGIRDLFAHYTEHRDDMGAESCGAVGAFFLDVGISSTHHIARFWCGPVAELVGI
jgi:hypothetical protein